MYNVIFAGDNSMLILSTCVHVYLYACALLLSAGQAGCCWFVGERRDEWHIEGLI